MPIVFFYDPVSVIKLFLLLRLVRQIKVALITIGTRGREYIVDLMADPCTLIPSDIAGSHIDYEKSFFLTRPLPVDSSLIAASSSGVIISYEEQSEWQTPESRYKTSYLNAAGNQSDERRELVYSADLLLHNNAEEGSKKSSARSHGNVGKETVWEIPRRPNHSHMHVRSPSWTEGVSTSATRKMKVKDVSQYMINAAKENSQLALHNVLLESGVVAPPDLFTEIYQEQVNITVEHKSSVEDDERNRRDDTSKTEGQGDLNLFLPPLPYHDVHAKGGHSAQSED